MVSKVMMTVLLGIDPNDPDIQLYIRAADDIINSILSLPLDLPGFTFRKVSTEKENQKVVQVLISISRFKLFF